MLDLILRHLLQSTVGQSHKQIELDVMEMDSN